MLYTKWLENRHLFARKMGSGRSLRNPSVVIISLNVIHSIFSHNNKNILSVPTCGSESLLTAEEQTFMKISIAGELFTDAKTRQIRFREGARATFTCRDGDMQLFGIGETECLSDGSWKDFERLTCSKYVLLYRLFKILIDRFFNRKNLSRAASF